MKKLLYLFSASLLVLTACSKDDDNNSSDSASFVLPKTIKYSEPSYPSSNSASTVTYNGNKIVSIAEEGERTDFTYDGNLIVKITNYDIEGGKDVKSYEESYTYANNKLSAYSYADDFSTQFPGGQYKGREVLTYNSDGTVKRESYTTDTTTGLETKSSYITVCTYANGNLIKEVSTNSAVGSNNVDTNVYEYDSKNNPFKNILGVNLLLINNELCSMNNRVKDTYSTVSGSTPSKTYVYKTDYVYDANGYPTKKTSFASNGETVEYIDEYTY